MTTSPARIVSFPSARPRLHPSAWQGFTGFASPTLDQAQYEADCVAGRGFPRPGDTDLLRRCRDAYRIRHWMELFRRFHTRFYAQQHATESRFRLYFPPLLDVRPSDLTRPVVMQWFHEIGRHSHMQANHALSLLRTMFTKAEEWQLWDGDNPASRIRWYKKDARTRFIQPEEMPALLESLALEAIPVQTFFLTCLLTGCRGGEARAMKWTDLNLTQGVWHKPTTKTGTPHTVPLPPALVGMLSLFPRTDAWVFCSPRRPGGPVKKSTCFHNWKRIRERAALPDITIHDLRRTCASFLAISGENIAVIAKVLNHTSFQTTQIYARLNMAPVTTALHKHADRLLGMGHASLTEPAPQLSQAESAQPLAHTDGARPGLHRCVVDQNNSEPGPEWPG